MTVLRKTYLWAPIFLALFPVQQNLANPSEYIRLDPEKITSLATQWRFQTGDNTAYALPEFNDQSWKQIPIAGQWYQYGIQYDGIAWYRLKLRLATPIKENLAVRLPGLTSASEVFFNGVKIGGKGAIFLPNGGYISDESPSVYTIPKNLLREENVLAIRVRSKAGLGGGFLPYYSIGPADKIWHGFYRYLGAQFMLAASFIIIGLFYFILFFARRIEASSLYFSTLSILAGLFTLGFQGLTFFIWDNYIFYNLAIHANTSLSGTVFVFFANSFYSRKGGRFSSVMAIYGLFSFAHLLVSQFSESMFFSHIEIVLIVDIIAILTGIMYFIGVSIQEYRKRNTLAYPILIGFAILGLGIFNDTLTFLNVFHSMLLFQPTYLVAILSMATALTIKISHVYEEREKAQRQILETLQKTDKLKDEFLANTSHELRTPLNEIIGISESLIDGSAGELPSAARLDLQHIALSAARLSTLVNDILDYSKMKNHELKLNIKSVSLNAALEMVEILLGPMAKRKNLRIVNKIKHSFPPVLADENRLVQIFMNLVGNAVKFTPAGEITIFAEASNGFAKIGVRDTGPGISKEHQASIFESFEQVEDSLTRKHGGTGLGLSITKSLVEMQDGQIYVESDVGHGATFFFTLPLSSEAPVPSALDLIPDSRAEINDTIAQDELLPPVPSQETIHILIVDDEEVNMRALLSRLRLSGYSCEYAYSGTEALARINEKKPDLVLLDVMMPEMSGYEVCKRIRERFRMFELPVLMLTARTNTEDLVAGFQAGANDYVKKPFDKQELLSRIHTLITLKKAVEIRDKYEVVEKELELAKTVQKSIIPIHPPKISGLKIVARYEPMMTIGGDLYHFIPLPDEKLGVFIGDVSGHGISASMLSGIAKMSAMIAQTFAEQPSEYLRVINRQLVSMMERAFVTGLYAFLDLREHSLTCASAGHPPLLIFHKKSNKIEALQPGGTVLGMFDDPKYEQVQITIEEGDRVYLYTDGMVESFKEESDLDKQLEAFSNEILSTTSLSLEEQAQTLFQTAKKRMGSDTEDDITYVMLEVLT